VSLDELHTGLSFLHNRRLQDQLKQQGMRVSRLRVLKLVGKLARAPTAAV